MYFPDLKKKQAVRKLRSWINYNRELCEELKQLNCKDKCRFFTPRQIQAIIHYLGEPDKGIAELTTVDDH